MLSGALKLADKVTVSMQAVGNKIRLNSQGREDARIIGDREVVTVVPIKGQLYLPPAAPIEIRARRPRRLARGGLRARRLQMGDALHDAGNGVTWADSTQRVRALGALHRQLGRGCDGGPPLWQNAIEYK
jgi:hypothetical protein